MDSVEAVCLYALEIRTLKDVQKSLQKLLVGMILAERLSKYTVNAVISSLGRISFTRKLAVDFYCMFLSAVTTKNMNIFLDFLNKKE